MSCTWWPHPHGHDFRWICKMFLSFRLHVNTDLASWKTRNDHFWNWIPEWIIFRTLVSCVPASRHFFFFSFKWWRWSSISLDPPCGSLSQILCFLCFSSSVRAPPIGPEYQLHHFLWCYTLQCGCTFFLIVWKNILCSSHVHRALDVSSAHLNQIMI